MCRGASPIFSARASVIIMAGAGWAICWMSHWPVSQAFVVLAKSRVEAAVAWVRKYLVAASAAWDAAVIATRDVLILRLSFATSPSWDSCVCFAGSLLRYIFSTSI